MKCKKHSLVIVIVASAMSVLATLGLVVVHPTVAAFADTAAPATLGTYQISCFTTGLSPEPCTPGPTANTFETAVNTAVKLDAHVTDSSGNLAMRGLWIFQDCLLKGIPAPSVQCDSGSGLWSNIQEVHFQSGLKFDVRIAYGIVSTAQTIGFRFRYPAQGSGIANGISNSIDVTWS